MTTLRHLFRQNGHLCVLFIVLTLSLSLNVWLGLEVRAAARPRSAANGGIVAGDRLGPIPIVDSSGQKTTIVGSSAQSVVVYVMSPTCIWCAKNYNNIVAVAKHARSGVRFVGVSTSGTPAQLAQHLRDHPYPFEVFLLDKKTLSSDSKLSTATPQTLVVNRDGVVEHAWMGAFIDEKQDEVERYFGVTLPGLESGASKGPGDNQ